MAAAYARCQGIYAYVGLLSRLPGLEPLSGQPQWPGNAGLGGSIAA
jgi:hypothetical protein